MDMARPLRIEYSGARYHVVNRGNQKQKIFCSPSHYGSKTIESPFARIHSQAIIGEENFVEGIKRSYDMKLNLAGARRQKELSRLKSGFDFDEIIVSALAKVGKALILRRKSVYSP